MHPVRDTESMNEYEYEYVNLHSAQLEKTLRALAAK